MPKKWMVIMMKKRYRTIISMLAASAMVGMTACGGNVVSPPGSGSGSTQMGMGRYVEQDCSMPVPLSGLLGLHRADDGTVSFFADNADTEGWDRFSSADGGNSWINASEPLIAASGLTQLDTICPKPDGGILVAGTYYSPEFMEALKKLQESGVSYTEELKWPPYQLIDVSPDGTTREIPIKLPDRAAGHIAQMAIAPSGELAAQSYDEVYRFDMETGALLGTITLESNGVGSIAFSGNKLAVMVDGIAHLYDFESGDPLETIDQLGFSQSASKLNVSTTDNHIVSAVAVGEDGAFYFCTSAGIYRKTDDGGVVERIVDGTLVSLSTPSVELTDLLVVENGFLVAMRDTVNDKMMVKKYSFYPTVPTLPDKSLRIYALSESKTIRQAIGHYQAQHPDTHVVLEIAPPELSTTDAIRALNTELLAGNGPDLLILDGMPVGSYIEKGVLLPLDEVLLEGTLSNITQAGRVADGKLYSVPTRFAIPAVTVDGTAPPLNSIAAIADAVAAKAAQQKGSAVAMVLQNCGGAILLNTLYPVFAETLQEDGKLDEAKLRDFLEQLHSITALQDSENPFVTDDSPNATLDMQWSPLTWCLDTDVMGMGYIRSLRDFANAASAVDRVPGGRLEALTFAGSHPFIPLTSLGVCAGSPNADSATEFIRLALSPSVQEYDFKDGLPVNSKALDTLLTYSEDNIPQMGAYGTSDSDGEVVVINIVYPSPEAIVQLRDMVAALDTPAVDNRVTLELLRSETEAYFNGTTNLDDTMTTLWQKLLLLGAE